MNANIVELPSFHDHHEPVAPGRSLRELKSNEVMLIERFIDGQYDGTGHRELAAFLLRNPEWICWVATRVNEQFETSHHGPKGYFLRCVA